LAKNNFYAVQFQSGQQTVFRDWPSCQRAVSGQSNVKFKGFPLKADADFWLKSLAQLSPDNTTYALMIYVDGAYFSNCLKAGWAWVAVKGRQVLAENSGVTQHDALSRNIDGELEAAVQAMKWAGSQEEPVVICHDYAGIAEWAHGTWKAKSQIARQYVDKIQSLKKGIKFVKVQGHSGDKWNDYVDNLAKKSVEHYLSGQ
jgi:ribonuclease HI